MRSLSAAARRHAEVITLQVTAGALVIGGVALTSVFAAAWLAVMVASLTVFVLLPGLTVFVSAAVFPLMVLDIRVLRHVLQTGGLPRDAVWVPSTTHAGLHAAVREAAEAMGTSPPDRIWLTCRPTASVHQVRRLLRRPRHIRQICIGLPLLAGLSRQELRAVLCHELAHYTQRHATFSTLVYRGSVLLGATRMRLSREELPTSDVLAVDRLLKGMAWLQRQIGAVYFWTYDVMTLFVRRRHEYAADRAAAEIWTAETVALALQNADTTAAAWARFATQFARAQHEGALPTGDLFHLFALTLDHPQPLSPQVSAPWHRTLRDSHPPLQHRLKALAPSGKSGPPRALQESALGLLDPDPDLLIPVAGLIHPVGPRRVPAPGSETAPTARRAWLGSLMDAAFMAAASAALLTFWILAFGARSLRALPLGLILEIAAALAGLGLFMAAFSPAAGPRHIRRWLNPLNVISVALLLFIGSYSRGTGLIPGNTPTPMMSVCLLMNAFVFASPMCDPSRRVGAARTVLAVFFAGGFAFGFDQPGTAMQVDTDVPGQISWDDSTALLLLLPSVVVLVWPRVRRHRRRRSGSRRLRADSPTESEHD
ncbi:M48 family metallopeptidase [Streptomyces sp. NPDC046853]|uniref:M48 family metallopeptidase n=1 Tax=Streptomyces sp. NPDC046853 TaxID=3154920 RepID=UPI0033E6D474